MQQNQTQTQKNKQKLKNRAKSQTKKINFSKKDTASIYTVIESFFQPLPQSKKGDWLYSQKETGQTYEKYQISFKKINKKIIYLLPLQNRISPSLIQRLVRIIQGFYYTFQVKLLFPIEIDELGVKKRINDGREQYHAGQILESISKKKPQDSFCLVGFLITDIYPRESWNFVFGLAQAQTKVSVFSFARYHESFQKQKLQFPFYDKIDDFNEVCYRACAVMCHEIGHLFNLRHCIFYFCLMNGSNSLEEAKKKPFQLCPICLRKLLLALQGDLFQWYKNFNEALKDIGVGTWNIK